MKNPFDNYGSNGEVKVTIPGDINGDGTVGVSDPVILSAHYIHFPPDRHAPGTPEYNDCLNSNIDGDGLVGLSDAIILSIHCGQTDP
jgi:hypothetical protein